MNDLKPLHKLILAVVFLASITTLQFFGKEFGTIAAIGLLLLGVGGYAAGQINAKVDAVKHQTNGGQREFLEALRENSRQQAEVIKLVARLAPVPAELPQTTEEKSYIDGEVKPNDEFVGSSR